MLPDAYDAPPGRHQNSIGAPVPLDVPLQLGRPVPLIDRWLAAVLRTDVPEAAVDEDCDLPPRENDVRANSCPIELQREVLPEPVAHSVQGRPQDDFRLSVAAPVRLHVPGSPGVQRGGIDPACVSSTPRFLTITRRHKSVVFQISGERFD